MSQSSNWLKEKVYLGDSVYAQFDGYNIVLTTQNDDSGPSNIIVLEPEVFGALTKYADKVGRAKLNTSHEEMKGLMEDAGP
mgnify:FL=1